MSLARETGLELAVRSGGHSMAGHGVSEGGIVLDLSKMKALDIDARERTAWAQTGLTAGEYTAAAGAHGLATGFGDTASVGIGGLTLGGGVGFLVRKHGLTIDDLLAADLVTADGELLHVDAESHPDLFWAIRGGGGNFGVATRFRYRLHELDTILGGMLILPATPEVIAAFVAEAEAAPDELSAIANIMVAPPMPFLPAEAHGKPIVMALVCYAGRRRGGRAGLAPFRALGPPLADMIRPMPYPEIYRLFGDEAPPRPRTRPRARSSSTRSTPRRRQRSSSTSGRRPHRWRGAAAGAGRRDGAGPGRCDGVRPSRAARHDDARGGLRTGRRWSRARGMGHQLHGRACRGDTGVYVNFLGDEGEARVREAYPGSTWDRLAAVKRRYDPTNLFRLNQNIAVE